MKPKFSLLCSPLVGGVLASMLLPAASLAAEPADEAAGANAVQEVVVTALKKQVSVQDVPASVTAVTGEALASQGIVNLEGMTRLVPNLVFGQFLGSAQITLRGMGSNVDSGITEPTVALYVDGVYLPRATMASLRAVDLDRVEALRGPQGTLYGRNATAGAINFISAAPTDDFAAKVEASVGSRDGWGVNGYVSGPIANGVSVRLSGGRERQDGYVEIVNTGQKVGGVNATYARAAIRFEPTSNLTNTLSFRYDRDKAAVTYFELFEAPLVGTPAQYTLEDYKVLADHPSSSTRRTYIIDNQLSWKISDNLSLRSTTAYVDHKAIDELDADGSLVPLYYYPDPPGFRRPSRSFSQEVTLLGTSDKLEWILGAFYFNQHAGYSLPFAFDSASGLPPGAALADAVFTRVESVAIYADVTYPLTDRLRLNVGLRYNHEDNTYNETISFTPFVPVPVTGVHKVSTDKVLPKVALQYDWAPDVSSYAQWSRGFKSGGANLPDGGAIALLPPYGPETVDAYEVGVKARLLQRRLTANVAAFYYDYNGLQITKVVPPGATVVNNADAIVYGIEGDFKWAVTDNLTVSLAPTLMHAAFNNFVSLDPLFNVNVDLDGKALPRAPKFTVNAGLDGRFQLPLNRFDLLEWHAGVQYNSTTVLRYYDTTPIQHQGPYAVANLSASLVDEDSRTRITGFVNNVGDRLYKVSVLNTGVAFGGYYGAPRTWGLKISKEF